MISVRSGWIVFVLAAMSPVCAEELETPKTHQATVEALVWLNQQARLQDARHLAAAWLQSHPDDGDVIAMQAATMFLQAEGEPDAARATDLRKGAFVDASRARKLGSKDIMIDLVLSRTDAEGRSLGPAVGASASPEVRREMQQGEQAFGQHDLAAALAAYQRAWSLDPHCYEAALYIGDVFFSQQKFADGIEWFRKAAALDPNRETAHRYLGDACARAGKLEQARTAYIDAVVAEPYSRMSRNALQEFAEATHRPLRAPKVERLRASVSWVDGKVQVNVDPNAGALDLAYAVGRAHWCGEERPKYFAQTEKPRHSLYEECAGLRLLIATAGEIDDKADDASRRLKPSIASLAAIEKAGLLEAYVLLDAADEGIARDYSLFRQLHRDALVRYINEFWLSGASSESKGTTRPH